MSFNLKFIQLPLIILMIAGTLPVSAQLSYGGEPYNWSDKRVDLSIPTIATEALDMDRITAEDAVNDFTAGIPFRFGIGNDVNYSIHQYGQWVDDVESGYSLWQLGIHCPDAKSINLTFSEYQVPKGGKLYIYSADRQDYLGSFDHRNVNESGILATGIIHSDKVIIELLVPTNRKQQTKLTVGQIVHGYRRVLRNERIEMLGEDDRGPFGSSGNCHNNVICPVGSDWQLEKHSVVLIVIGNYLCSGVLVNNTANDGRPYILSAHHCMPTGSNNVSNWVFYFNHDSPTCNGSTGPTNQSISGATFRAKRAGSDFALVEMSSSPPASWNAHYAGWDRSDSENITNSVGIHHPAGDVKKISFDNDAPIKMPLDGTQVWVIDAWDDGVTETGSSGSPLFNQDHRIVGQLYAGTSACIGTNENNGYDIYGRFGISWSTGSSTSTRLKEWLDPGNTGVTVLDGYPTAYNANEYDVAAINVSGISPMVCGNSITPVLTLRNNGSVVLTTCTITYQLNSETQQTMVWNGSLGFNESTQVTLPTMSYSTSVNSLSVSVSNPNNVQDQNTNNNTLNINFNADLSDSFAVRLALTFDEYPEETNWTLRNANNQIIYTSGGQSYNESYAETTIHVEFCLPQGCYTFNIFDTEGDGICCQYGQGSYVLSGPTGFVIANGGNFNASQTVPFCVDETLNIETEDAQELAIYPNPAQDILNIQHPTRIESVTIRDVTGKLVSSSQPFDFSTQVSVVQIPNGIYLCHIVTEGGTYIQKLVVRH
jgi:lysyl endopeptidase